MLKDSKSILTITAAKPTGRFETVEYIRHGVHRHVGVLAAIRADDMFLRVRPERLIKTRASDRFMTVVDFVLVANPPMGSAGGSQLSHVATPTV